MIAAFDDIPYGEQGLKAEYSNRKSQKIESACRRYDHGTRMTLYNFCATLCFKF